MSARVPPDWLEILLPCEPYGGTAPVVYGPVVEECTVRTGAPGADPKRGCRVIGDGPLVDAMITIRSRTTTKQRTRDPTPLDRQSRNHGRDHSCDLCTSCFRIGRSTSTALPRAGTRSETAERSRPFTPPVGRQQPLETPSHRRAIRSTEALHRRSTWFVPL